MQSRRTALEASRLRKRIKAGRLTWDDVSLAAYLGHPAALHACKGARAVPETGRLWSGSQRVCKSLFRGAGTARPFVRNVRNAEWSNTEAISQVGDWAYGLGAWGRSLMLLAAVTAARLALTKFERRFPRDPGPRRAVTAAASVLEGGKRVKPGEIRTACRAALKSGRSAARRDGFDRDIVPGHCPAYDAACAANQAAKLAHLMLTFRPPNELPAKMREFAFQFVTSRAVRYAAGATSARIIRAAVRKALLECSLKGGRRRR